MNNENTEKFNAGLQARIERAKRRAQNPELAAQERSEKMSAELQKSVSQFKEEAAVQTNASEQMAETPETAADEKYTDGYAAKKAVSKKDLFVKIGSISMTLVLMLVLILNVPIINFKEKGKENERVSIITFIKRQKPLNYIEGDLLPNNGENLNINNNIVTPDFSDGLNLPQIIEGQYTILFHGFDEKTLNTDVNWVFQFDIAHKQLNVLQIPRDSLMIDYTDDATGKFNSIYARGDQDLTPIQRTVNAVQDNFGIPIDAYVTTHCYDIVDIVDLVGGIPIELDEQIIYEPGKIIPAGKNVLDGQKAEWFVRFRHGFAEGDIGRVKNQRKFLAAAMKKMMNIIEDDGRIKFYGYLKTIYEKELIATNLSLENISMLADLASTIDMENVYVTMVPGEGADYPAPDGKTYSIWSIHKQATLDILNEHFRPYQNDLTPEYSAIKEFVKDGNYLTHSYDNTGDNLDEIDAGAKPGVNKPKPTEANNTEGQ